MSIFLPVRFNATIQLSTAQWSLDSERELLNKLRTTHEGLCTRYGYIRKNSLEILHKSRGVFVKQHFNGAIKYDVTCKAEICDPVAGVIGKSRGSFIKALVIKKNEYGMLAESTLGETDPIIECIIPTRAAGISDIGLTDGEKASINDIGELVERQDYIYIEVIEKKFVLNKPRFHIIGRYVGRATVDDDWVRGAAPLLPPPPATPTMAAGAIDDDTEDYIDADEDDTDSSKTGDESESDSDSKSSSSSSESDDESSEEDSEDDDYDDDDDNVDDDGGSIGGADNTYEDNDY